MSARTELIIVAVSLIFSYGPDLRDLCRERGLAGVERVGGIARSTAIW